MKKIRCPNCSVINLEGFVTFPHCAGCGARLPEDAAQPEPVVWRRPMGTLIWASALGVAILSVVLIATNMLSHQRDDESRIVMLGMVQSRVYAGQPFDIEFRVDAMEEVSHNDELLRGVRLRFPVEVFRRFQYVSLRPPPDAISDSGAGRYFYYATLSRGARLHLKLRALRLGRQVVTARVYADNQSYDDFITKIMVHSSRDARAQPNESSRQRSSSNYLPPWLATSDFS
ncbi:MAG TPA: hypothetical protein VF719_06755 [Abditibacteriaceae bacterium]|jgi:hypothetical protein